MVDLWIKGCAAPVKRPLHWFKRSLRKTPRAYLEGARELLGRRTLS